MELFIFQDLTFSYPGQEPFANLRQVPQKSPQAAISGFIISVRSSSWAPRS